MMCSVLYWNSAVFYISYKFVKFIFHRHDVDGEGLSCVEQSSSNFI